MAQTIQKALDAITPLGRRTFDGLYLNRELSWLEFNLRVLHEALDERTPLLERVMFLSIFNSNLDEFFQKRVGGLKRQIAAGVAARTPDGLSSRETIASIRYAVLDMLKVQADCYTQQIRPALASHGVHLLDWDDLDENDLAFCRSYFRDVLFPVLTPLAVDPGHPFPFISNLSTSLGVMLRHPDADTSQKQFARVKVPQVLPRWVRLGSPTLNQSRQAASGGEMRYVHIRDLIGAHIQDLFEGMIIEDMMAFRITRNADVERDEEDAEDLLNMIEQELRDRRFAPVVRMEVESAPNEEMVRFLMHELSLEEADVYRMPAELDYTDLSRIADLDMPELKSNTWVPHVPQRLQDEEADIFSVIRAGDVLVHHPYESFNASVERFIRAATADPKVVAIKQTLYRTSADSPFIPDLIAAAESGKQVICLVELKARFDEERNIQVAQTLEKAGVHVVYGIVGLKTHTKTAMVVRQEADGMRVYCHIGTGNYNSNTANLYTDLGLLTCDREMSADIVELFHYLTGRSVRREFRHLLIAPINMRSRFVEMIDREIAHCSVWLERGGEPDDPHRPRIIAKMNSLEDRDMVKKLYEASEAGVRIDLIVRGFCCLRPGVPGMSENIRVISVIGRFLEHSRIFAFHNDGKPEYYIGSADWMYRNLNNRVECITPVMDAALQQKLANILDICLTDRRQAWEMRSDGSYVQRRPAESGDDESLASILGTHEALMRATRAEAMRAEMVRPAVYGQAPESPMIRPV